MEATPLTRFDVNALSDAVKDQYANFTVAEVNDHVVRLSVMTESYFWHYHPDSDETFMTMEGILLIDLEDKTIELGPNQLFTIPKNTIHRTRPGNGRSVNITIEHHQMTTIKTASP